jgi:hypothetical protein
MPTHQPAEDVTEAVAPEPVPEHPPPAQAEAFTNEGAIPEVAKDQPIQPTASDQAFGDVAATDTGLWTVEAYKAALDTAGRSDKWQDRYLSGHTAAPQWVQPYEGPEALEFHLKKGESAADAVADFVKGPTIADYRVIGVALDLDELRDDLGAATFDRYFGSKDGNIDGTIPAAQRLSITSAMYTTPYVEQMKTIVENGESAKQQAEAEPPQEIAKERAEEQKPEEVEQKPVLAEETNEAKREVV